MATDSQGRDKKRVQRQEVQSGERGRKSYKKDPVDIEKIPAKIHGGFGPHLQMAAGQKSNETEQALLKKTLHLEQDLERSVLSLFRGTAGALIQCEARGAPSYGRELALSLPSATRFSTAATAKLLFSLRHCDRLSLLCVPLLCGACLLSCSG